MESVMIQQAVFSLFQALGVQLALIACVPLVLGALYSVFMLFDR